MTGRVHEPKKNGSHSVSNENNDDDYYHYDLTTEINGQISQRFK